MKYIVTITNAGDRRRYVQFHNSNQVRGLNPGDCLRISVDSASNLNHYRQYDGNYGFMVKYDSADALEGKVEMGIDRAATTVDRDETTPVVEDPPAVVEVTSDDAGSGTVETPEAVEDTGTKASEAATDETTTESVEDKATEETSSDEVVADETTETPKKRTRRKKTETVSE